MEALANTAVMVSGTERLKLSAVETHDFVDASASIFALNVEQSNTTKYKHQFIPKD